MYLNIMSFVQYGLKSLDCGEVRVSRTDFYDLETGRRSIIGTDLSIERFLTRSERWR